MDIDDTALRKRLRDAIDGSKLLCGARPRRYEQGDRLALDLTGVCPAAHAQAEFRVDKFAGGGFAGQVYRAVLEGIAPSGGECLQGARPATSPIPGLHVGCAYALKILVPPSAFALRFRNAVYWAAYQGHFSAQVLPAAARAGVLWQKAVRRAAAVRFGREDAVVDAYATFRDPALGSFGEVNEWVDGRTWIYEVDDRLHRRWRWKSGPLDGSPEYVAKRRFMRDMVALLHEVGAPELARQYEWWTCKSQPNVLKRLGANAAPAEGLVAIDWRAGLALLPFLPMSPADVKLIWDGLGRGDFVQFDRGDVPRLMRFAEQHADAFADLRPALEELAGADAAYRASLPDVTHHAERLIWSPALRRSVREGLAEGWRVKYGLDADRAEALRRCPARAALFFAVGLLPLLGNLCRRAWGGRRFAAHLRKLFTDFGYLARFFRARRAGVLLEWRRAGAVGPERALRLLDNPFLFWLQVAPLFWLPPKWRRFVAEPGFAWRTLRDSAAHVLHFYRDADFRVQWLVEQAAEGRKEGMLTEEEEREIAACAGDPFIQKYLKSVAVHLCTLPVTQLVALSVAVYAMLAFGRTWGEGLAWAAGTLAFFQLTPISPGSVVRGTYVVYLMARERDVKNYWVAGLVSFWHYVGYLGFPLQMVHHYPTLSRFMAGRWATGMTRAVPVFGEKGGLLEHFVFDAFFNVPLTLRRLWRRLPRRLRVGAGWAVGAAGFAGMVALIWWMRMRGAEGGV